MLSFEPVFFAVLAAEASGYCSLQDSWVQRGRASSPRSELRGPQRLQGEEFGRAAPGFDRLPSLLVSSVS